MLLCHEVISIPIWGAMDKIARIERRLKLQDVRVLLAVVQAGSMGKAAARLGTSQPAVSRSISDLEHALGVRLLDRSPRGVEPTPYGRALINRGIAVFDEIRQGINDIEFLADPTAGELRIGASIVVASGFVSAVTQQLSRRHPRIVFHILAGEAATTYRALHERKIDLLIARIFTRIVDEQMQIETLYEEPHVVVSAKGSPWSRRRKVSLADLANEPWVLPPADTVYGALYVEAFRAAGLPPPPATVVTYTNPVRQALAASGRFLTIVPESVVRFEGKQSKLQALPIDLPTLRKPIGIITLKHRTVSPVAQLFIDCAREIAKSLGRGRQKG